MIDPTKYGVSFSIKQCSAFGADPAVALDWLLKQGWRRFRLMSYWNEHETSPGQYDFTVLDAQIDQISAVGGIVTLCLGARQPRWPENHWPDWAWQAKKTIRSLALLRYIKTTVDHFKNRSCIVSYQLENEALLSNFGRRAEVDHGRLRKEFKLVKQLDPTRPVAMSTSTSWGIPLRRPIPDSVGFSFYQQLYNSQKHAYTTAFHSPWLDRQRAVAIRLLWDKPSFVHELQCEPWGPTAIWKMPVAEQDKSMGPKQIVRNINLAKQIGIYPIDFWGAEWWYWRALHGDPSIWQTVKSFL